MSGKQKRDPKDYVIGPDATISDIDLDEEEFTAPDGSRLTEAKAEQLAAAALAEKRKANLIPGRKSLGKDGSHSPVVQFRSPRKDEAQAIADELGISISELARRAFDGYLDEVSAARVVTLHDQLEPVVHVEPSNVLDLMEQLRRWVDVDASRNQVIYAPLKGYPGVPIAHSGELTVIALGGGSHEVIRNDGAWEVVRAPDAVRKDAGSSRSKKA